MGFFRSRKPKADDRWTSGAFAESSGAIGETSLTVAVRSRPLLPDERRRGDKPRDIVRVLDDKHVVVLDPDFDEKNYLDERTHRTKERRYTFDKAFGAKATNRDVYQKTARALISGVLNGQNGTVFAYGSTGSGKTYTMIGTSGDPGMMPLSLVDIFDAVRSMSGEYTFEVTCSYLEVYNELIYDLLVPNSPSLDLREDPERGATVSGLKKISVTNADNVLDVLREGNARRKTEPTEANAVSSRSHAVMEINVRRFNRVGEGGDSGSRMDVLTGRLSLVDLAGSERASETKNEGSKLRDGANINRSLLALANCINALGKKQQGAGVYVPFRNSKLTRLLKDSLTGNSRTAMVANVSCGDDQYGHTVNTLKYADRAKEIKTNVQTNVISVGMHPGEAQRVIEQLQGEVAGLRKELKAARSSNPSKSSFFGGKKTLPKDSTAAGVPDTNENKPPTQQTAVEVPPEPVAAAPSSHNTHTHADTDAADNEWLEKLSVDVHDNTEERINLQRALFELEDVAITNRCELNSVEDKLVELEMTGQHLGFAHKAQAESLRDRRRRLAESLREGDVAARRDRLAMNSNEHKRREIQVRIDRATREHVSRGGPGKSNAVPAFLKILSRHQMRQVSSMEAHFQLAVRDACLADQRDVIGCMWRMLRSVGVTREAAIEAARRDGVFGMYDGSEQTGEETEVYALESETVVGARAKERLAFWQSYDAVDDLTVGTGKHPPPAEHQHQHQHHAYHQQHQQHQPRDQHQPKQPPHHGPSTRQLSSTERDPTAALLSAAAATLAKSPPRAQPEQQPTPTSPRATAIAKLRDRGGSGRRKSYESIPYSESSRPASSGDQVSDSAYSGQTSRNLSARGMGLDGAGGTNPRTGMENPRTEVQTAYARVDKAEEVKAGFIPTQGRRGAPPIAASAYKTMAGLGGTRASVGSRPTSSGRRDTSPLKERARALRERRVAAAAAVSAAEQAAANSLRLRSPQPDQRAFGMADTGAKPEIPVAYVMRP